MNLLYKEYLMVFQHTRYKCQIIEAGQLGISQLLILLKDINFSAHGGAT